MDATTQLLLLLLLLSTLYAGLGLAAGLVEAALVETRQRRLRAHPAPRTPRRRARPRRPLQPVGAGLRQRRALPASP